MAFTWRSLTSVSNRDSEQRKDAASTSLATPGVSPDEPEHPSG
ncbi:hypothetical protein [Segetibacter koreensis]|nr:hypothetical protein [Segetibacter koreensis]